MEPLVACPDTLIGRKRRRDEVSDSDDDDNTRDAMSSLEEVFAPSNKRRRVTRLDAKIIPKFDPEQKFANVKEWLHRIDQMGWLHQWNEMDKIAIMRMRLRGIARDWYYDLGKYDYNWPAWKIKLIKTFPSSVRIEQFENVVTKKSSEELLEKCNQNRSGSLLSLRVTASPEEEPNSDLYYGFLSSLENFKKVTTRNVKLRSTWPEENEDDTKPCYNCLNMGHVTRDCPTKKCSYCQNLGHDELDCWYAAGPSRGQQQFHSETVPQMPRSPSPVASTSMTRDAIHDILGLQDHMSYQLPSTSHYLPT